MINCVVTDFVGPIVVRPQDFSCRRIAIDYLKPQAVTLLDEIRHRFQTNLKFVDFVGCQRPRIGMALVRDHVRAAFCIERAVRSAQPSARDEFGKRIKSLAAPLRQRRS